MVNTQRTLFAEQDQLVLVKLTRLQAIVSLFQALGGGWVIPDDIAANRGGGHRLSFRPRLRCSLGEVAIIDQAAW